MTVGASAAESSASVLSATGYKVKGSQYADLKWTKLFSVAQATTVLPGPDILACSGGMWSFHIQIPEQFAETLLA